MGNLDVHNLSESHQFVILLLVQVAQLATTFLLYKSSPNHKKAPDGSPLVSDPSASDPTLPGK